MENCKRSRANAFVIIGDLAIPTEHEFKYLIDLSLMKKYDHEDLKSKCVRRITITQGYLAFSKGMTARVRCQMEGKKSQWFFTFKQKSGNRVIEIERKITSRDGGDLWNVCVGKLKKTRYLFDYKNNIWELDLFEKVGKLYLIMVEVEMPEGHDRPKQIPSFLKEHILYEVPLTDDRFSNKRLGDAEFAAALYKKIKGKK